MTEPVTRRGWFYLIAALPLLLLPLLFVIDVETSETSDRIVGFLGIAGALLSAWLMRKATPGARVFNLLAMVGVAIVAAYLLLDASGQMWLWVGFGLMFAGFIGSWFADPRGAAVER